jgi:predicted enzyme related to lactoylglutathione lyase
MPNLFSYVELHTSEVEKCRTFYAELFGWEFERAPIPEFVYFGIQGEGEARGGLMKDERQPHWLPYVNVAELDAQIAKAQKLGATLLRPATPVPGQGTMAVLRDPGGAVFALWQCLPR